jgi:2-iminobutanoate/2-iminopropanoate deaminase
LRKTEVKHPGKVVSTGSYSAGILCDGWLYISGHASQDLYTGKVLPGTIQEETRRTLEHIGKVLMEAGATFDDIVKCTCYLASIDDFGGFDQAYREFFSGVMPARTTVQSGLGDVMKVEIDAVARIPQTKAMNP